MSRGKELTKHRYNYLDLTSYTSLAKWRIQPWFGDPLRKIRLTK